MLKPRTLSASSTLRWAFTPTSWIRTPSKDHPPPPLLKKLEKLSFHMNNLVAVSFRTFEWRQHYVRGYDSSILHEGSHFRITLGRLAWSCFTTEGMKIEFLLLQECAYNTATCPNARGIQNCKFLYEANRVHFWRLFTLIFQREFKTFWVPYSMVPNLKLARCIFSWKQFSSQYVLNDSVCSFFLFLVRLSRQRVSKLDLWSICLQHLLDTHIILIDF